VGVAVLLLIAGAIALAIAICRKLKKKEVSEVVKMSEIKKTQ